MSLYNESDLTVNASTTVSTLSVTRSALTSARNDVQTTAAAAARGSPSGRAAAAATQGVTVFIGQDVRQREPGTLQPIHGSQIYTLGGLMVASVSAVLVFALVYYQCNRRSRRYDLLHDGVGEPGEGGPVSRCMIHNAREHYEHVYKPSVFLDDEYENTFSGVSVPLLHEVSVV